MHLLIFVENSFSVKYKRTNLLVRESKILPRLRYNILMESRFFLYRICCEDQKSGPCQYESVVRLKGGDPFVFGRGHEELEHALRHGIEVEVIPGISSSLAVPATNGIPLTKRGINESFWVVTGTTSNMEVSSDLVLAARSSATVVILMGMRNLDKILSTFSMLRGDDEHIAIIQNGTCAHERMAIGTIGTIKEHVAANGISSPAVITIGEVVRFYQPSALSSMVKDIAASESVN